MKTLWPFQVQSVEALRQNIRKGIRRQVLCSPTGSGKTICALHIVAEAARKGKRAYFICDRQTLVNQTSERFHEEDIDHGILMGSNSRGLWKEVIIASAQTIEARGFDWLIPPADVYGKPQPAPDPDLVIIDEIHEIRKKIVKYVKEKNICTIGLSATPFTKGLAKYYQDVVNVTTTQNLVREGYLSPLKIIAAQSEVDVSGLTVSSTGEWVAKEVSDRVLQITGDMVPEWIKQTKAHFGGPVPTIVFTPTVADSEDAAEKFQAAGYDFRVVHYKQSADQKQEIIDRFKRGEHMGLISCVALTKGFDAPLTRCLIDAYPLRKSLSMHIQKTGRVMRIADGKDFGLIIDHSGNWLGFYDATHAFFDEGCSELSSESLQKATRQEPGTTSHLKCSCGYIFPPPEKGIEPIRMCPSCGKQRKRPRGRLQQVDGVLGQVDVIDGKGRKLPFSGDWWTELCAIASAMTKDDDKARRIALAKYKSIFHAWPKGQYQRVDRKPHPAVYTYSYNQFKRWKYAQKKKKERSSWT